MMNRRERRKAEAEQRKVKTDLPSLLHDNEHIKVVLDLSGDRMPERLDITGVLSEDSELFEMEGDPTIKVVAQCGDLCVFGCIINPKATDVPAMLARLKQGVGVRLVGMFHRPHSNATKAPTFSNRSWA
jgi:hypothetical protein